MKASIGKGQWDSTESHDGPRDDAPRKATGNCTWEKG